MTMTGGNAHLPDERGHLVDDSLSPQGDGPFALAIQAIKNLILPYHRELITMMRANTPQKVTRVFSVPASGILGNGVATPDLSLIVLQGTEAGECWLNRITITSPQHPPGTPLNAGSIILVGTTFNEIVLMAPDAGVQNNTIPVQFIEGGNAAPHLDRGESLTISGSGLTSGDTIRVDIQYTIVTGVSEFTPRKLSPSDLTRADSDPAI
jgi:hypothetical protein